MRATEAMKSPKKGRKKSKGAKANGSNGHVETPELVEVTRPTEPSPSAPEVPAVEVPAVEEPPMLAMEDPVFSMEPPPAPMDPKANLIVEVSMEEPPVPAEVVMEAPPLPSEISMKDMATSVASAPLLKIDHAPHAIGWSSEVSKAFKRAKAFHDLVMEIDREVLHLVTGIIALQLGDYDVVAINFLACGIMAQPAHPGRTR